MLSISNIYAHGFDPAQIDKLHRLGFNFRDQVSHFAGSQVLYFVDFAQGPALEFIQVEDKGEYSRFLPQGMTAYCPGISFLLPQNSSKSLSDIQSAAEKWGSYTLHVNDDGSDDPDKPGWHYLNFADSLIEATFIYLSSKIGPEPVRTRATYHPNRVIGVTDLIFALDDGALTNLAKLTETEIDAGSIDLGGVRIGSRSIWKGSIGLPQKRFPLAAVVLQADSLDFFQDQEDLEIIEYHSQPAAQIQMNARSWDLIVTT